eukprot:gene20360-31321_t
MCVYIVLSLVVVLAVFAGSDGKSDNSDVEGDMQTQTTCTVVRNTMNGDVNEEGKCRYHVDVYIPSSARRGAVAWSGIVENVWGDCDAAKVFSDRFTFSTFTDVDCWFDPDAPARVRLWSAREAGAAIPSEGDQDTAALVVVIVLLSVVIVLGTIYTSLRCGIFGDAINIYRSDKMRKLPNEPLASQSPRLQDQGLPFPVHSAPDPNLMLQAQTPNAPMVKVGLAQVPAYLAPELHGYSPSFSGDARQGYSSGAAPYSSPQVNYSNSHHPSYQAIAQQQQQQQQQQASPYPFEYNRIDDV